MAFNHVAGTAFLPTIARLVLCAAFLPQGWLKCFTTTEFTGAQAQQLQQMGVVTLPNAPGSGGSGNAPAFNTSAVTLAQQDQPGGQDNGAQPDEDENQPPPSEPPNGQDDPEPQPDDPQTEPEADGEAQPTDPQQPTTIEARKVYQIALLVNSADWPYPIVLAWLAALTELIGGALLLVGLLSRVWGLGFSIMMGVAFYLVTLDGAGDPAFANSILNQLPLEFARDTQTFNTAFSQIGLFFCALLVLLVGPGPLSIDRLLVGRRRAARQQNDEIYTE